MFEALEKIYERERRRLHPSVADPVMVRRFDDIKRVLIDVDPKNNSVSAEITINADMASAEDGKNVTYRVSAPSKSKSKREMIMDGLDILKRQKEAIEKMQVSDSTIEVNGVMMKPPSFGDAERSRAWVDPLIKHWLGAYRKDLLICWDIEGFHYEYDIYQHKLTRSQNESNDQ
jgi:hypothetical protein